MCGCPLAAEEKKRRELEKQGMAGPPSDPMQTVEASTGA